MQQLERVHGQKSRPSETRLTLHYHISGGTTRPEKLIAKLILASSNEGDVVFDPFLGSGTTSVVAKKLGRHYIGVELDETFACLAQKRLHMADSDSIIQGYADGVFWERNTVLSRKPQ